MSGGIITIFLGDTCFHDPVSHSQYSKRLVCPDIDSQIKEKNNTQNEGEINRENESESGK